MPEDQAERLVAQAARFGSHDLARYAELVAAGLADLKSTTAPRLLLELLCARLLLPGVDDGTHGLAARLDRMEKRLSITGAVSDRRPRATCAGDLAPGCPARAAAAGDGTARTRAPGTRSAGTRPRGARPEAPGPRRPVPSARPRECRPAPASGAGDGTQDRSGGPEQPRPADRGPVERAGPAHHRRHGVRARAGSSHGRPTADPAHADGTPTRRPAGAGGLTLTDLRRLWPEVVEAVKSQRRVTWIQLSQHAQVIGLDGRTLTIGFNNAGARESFVKGRSDVLVQQVLIDLVGQEWVVDAINDPSAQPGGTPDRVHKAAVPDLGRTSERPEARRAQPTRPGRPRTGPTPPGRAPRPARAARPPRVTRRERPGGTGRLGRCRRTAGAAAPPPDAPPWSDEEPPPPEDDAPPPPRRGRPRPEDFKATAAEPKVDPATTDAAAHRDDPTLDAQDTAALLSERLGAQVIEEIPHR